MCGRYSANDKVNDWIINYCSLPSEGVLRVGDIRPGERTPVIIAGKTMPLIVPMTWGIQGNGTAADIPASPCSGKRDDSHFV